MNYKNINVYWVTFAVALREGAWIEMACYCWEDLVAAVALREGGVDR